MANPMTTVKTELVSRLTEGSLVFHLWGQAERVLQGLPI
jgi:hypothetical protein